MFGNGKRKPRTWSSDSYRDDLGAAHNRIESLEGDLDRLRQKKEKSVMTLRQRIGAILSYLGENAFKLVMFLVTIGVGASAIYLYGVVEKRDAACQAACMRKGSVVLRCYDKKKKPSRVNIIAGKYDMLRGNTNVVQCTCFSRNAQYSWDNPSLTITDQEVNRHSAK